MSDSPRRETFTASETTHLEIRIETTTCITLQDDRPRRGIILQRQSTRVLAHRTVVTATTDDAAAAPGTGVLP